MAAATQPTASQHDFNCLEFFEMSSAPVQQQQQQGVFVDCVAGKHASTGVQLLLEKRRLIWRKDYGWTWDAWVDDPAQYALSGAHGR